METKPKIIPTMAYKDAKKAIQWLCDAFGFEQKVVHDDEAGTVVHAQLTHKGSMIMLNSSNNGSEFSKFINHPGEIDGFETQSPYIILGDDEIEAHYQKAKAHGAKIALELKAEDYGGKNYTCYDLEGHLWSFGSYDPWEND